MSRPWNWPACNEALKRRGSPTIRFDPEMSRDAVPKGRRGRRQTYGDTPIQTCLTMTGSHIGGTPILPDLLDQTPEAQEIRSVTADGACDTRRCHDAIADRGAHAVIPPRNAKPWKAIIAGALAIVLGLMAGTGAPSNEARRASWNLGRAL